VSCCRRVCLAGARLLRQAQTRQAHNIDEGATMAKGLIHTVYKSGQWINEIEEGEEIGGVHATKEEAVAQAGHGRSRTEPST